MSPHGETHPRPVDDRLPVLLVVLDGLGDRPSAELDGRTPAEAAHTPVLDALAAGGASGWHLPFGWGPAPASELAHWAMFGFADVPFPGRAVLEAIGAGVPVREHQAVTHAALRTSRVDGDRLWLTGRVAREDEADAAVLLSELDTVFAAHGCAADPLGGRGELLLRLPHDNGAVTDSDAFFEDLHPWLRVRPRDVTAEPTAATLNAVLADARGTLLGSPTNAERLRRGEPALDVLVTKWSGTRVPIPDFAARTGVAGAAVTSTRLYRGLSGLLGMSQRRLDPLPDVTADLAARLTAADELIEQGARFVHVHTKATDEAGHTKRPEHKRLVIEAADAGLAGLAGFAERAIVAVTGDHATPSVHGVLHTGDPTPLVLAGPTVRRDEVREFGEAPARYGWFGPVRAAELPGLLFSQANRPVFLGHRATPHPTLALPDDPEPMPLPPESHG